MSAPGGCPMLLPILLLSLLPSLSLGGPPPEALIRADRLSACAFAAAGAAILCSGEGDTNREIRLVTNEDLQQRPAEGLWFSEQRFITWGVTPLPFGDGKLLFVRRGSREGGLWVWDFANQQETQLRRDPFMGLPPAISADGSLILAYRWAGRSRRIGLVDGETGKFKSIPGKDLSYPALNTDGSRLLFIKDGQVWRREIIDPLTDDESRDVQLTTCDMPCSWPTWRPDQRAIAFVCKEFREKGDDTPAMGKVGILRDEGAEVEWIVEGLLDPRCPAFSPDGQCLIFLARDSERPSDDLVWRVRLE